MAQQTQSDSQGSMQFGEVDPTADQLIRDARSENSQPLIEQETSPIDRRQQEKPTIVNYGPCVMCNINERCVLFVGCNHLACCGQCSTACNNICPVVNCHQPIRERLHVFKP